MVTMQKTIGDTLVIITVDDTGKLSAHATSATNQPSDEDTDMEPFRVDLSEDTAEIAQAFYNQAIRVWRPADGDPIGFAAESIANLLDFEITEYKPPKAPSDLIY